MNSKRRKMDDTTDRWAHMEAHFEKNKTYETYHDLCMKLDTLPVSREQLIAVYVDILDRHEELYEQATAELDSDKRNLLEELENEGAPVEDLVTVNGLPPSVTVPINQLKGGMICLCVLFPQEPSKPHVITAYIEKGNDTAIFL